MSKAIKKSSAAAAADRDVAMDTTELQGSVQVQVAATSKKRSREETSEEAAVAEPSKKINKAPDDDAPAAAAVPLIDLFGDDAAAAAPPVAPSQVVQEIRRSPHILYPDQYKTFDKKLIAFAKDPQASKEGGGQILFMSYVYQSIDAATGGMRAATKPFMINTPNGMHLPTGITTWPDGKTTTLLSTGREYESNPLMMDVHQLIDAIQNRCIEVIIEKEWNSPNPNTVEAITDNFSPIMFVGIGSKGEQYPPSIKCTVTVAGPGRTEIFRYMEKPPLPTMLAAEVTAGSAGTAVIHIPWIYRKKLGKLWKFSVRINLFQIVVEPPSDAAGMDGAAPVCSVVY
ncbi:MAG: hypothetical protein P4L69_07125 [Desulfosporosinus sp.]|nr:hypothetical protein [Desulfosporosinus sp.]